MTQINSTRRYDKLPWILLAIVALIVFIYVVFFKPAIADGPIGKKHPSAGKALGTFRLDPLTKGSQPISTSDLLDKVVLIDYWGPRCPPCKRELPELIGVVERYKSRDDFLFLPVSCPLENTEEEIEHLLEDTVEFMSHIRATFPIYQLPEDVRHATDTPALGEMYLIALPTTLVIDRHGIIRGKWHGYQDGYENQIANLLAELLKDEK